MSISAARCDLRQVRMQSQTAEDVDGRAVSCRPKVPFRRVSDARFSMTGDDVNHCLNAKRYGYGNDSRHHRSCDLGSGGRSRRRSRCGRDRLCRRLGCGRQVRQDPEGFGRATRRSAHLPKFETLVGHVKGVGISQYNVNAADFNAVRLKANRARPDASAPMRSAFEANAHANWMRAKAAESLGDPGANVSHKEAMAGAQAAIDAKRRPHAG